MIEFIRWQVKLALLAMREHARWRRFTFDQRADNEFVVRHRIQGFLDRVSPFVYDKTAQPLWVGLGYRRVWIRRLVFPLAVPTLFIRRSFWRFAEGLLNRLAPYTGPGKFEGFADPRDAIKAEWLYEHSEYAELTTGSVSDWGFYAMLFSDLDVPWSRSPEDWLLTESGQGFVDSISGPDAERRFHEIDHDYVYDFENVDQYGGPDDSAMAERDSLYEDQIARNGR